MYKRQVYNRINLTQESYTTMETPGNFLMLLRKQIDGGILRSLNQVGLDRILHMVIEARDELGDCLLYTSFYISAWKIGKPPQNHHRP